MARIEQHIDTWGWPAAAVYGQPGQGGFVLVCEHASSFIPPNADGLGLSAAAKLSHAAWDIGALDMAKRLSVRLKSPLIAGEISRLVYDCNRPLEAPDCIPARSEIYDVPGNKDLSAASRQSRFDHIHTPFHDTVTRVLDAAVGEVILVTIHSFTPVYNDLPRVTELGYLSHSDDRLARACLTQEQERGRMKAALDEPYSATDGVTYSLQKHGEARGLLNVMIEVRNDLIDTPHKAQAMGDHLAATLIAAQKEVTS
ncbi:N-formylglutamate amidohydrolase [uncultured Pelagimonas sp.]|uniref:N-formylglutamate amidohydrolase n=1 Tax=uncultured Pelagimonas sp. TaxID=1618102 RepID=UPI002628A156|nr:N-formylglutamate amidohydrolase [uncultured Pelagimonas sp.]